MKHARDFSRVWSYMLVNSWYDPTHEFYNFLTPSSNNTVSMWQCVSVTSLKWHYHLLFVTSGRYRNIPTLPSFSHVTSDVSLNRYLPPEFLISASRLNLRVKIDSIGRIRTYPHSPHVINSPTPYPLGHRISILIRYVLTKINSRLDSYAKWCLNWHETYEKNRFVVYSK